jgi:hypothetical protein
MDLVIHAPLVSLREYLKAMLMSRGKFWLAFPTSCLPQKLIYTAILKIILFV